jgi:hypothetical protein
MNMGKGYLLLGLVSMVLLAATAWKPKHRPTIVELPAGQKFVACGFVGVTEKRFYFVRRPMTTGEQPESVVSKNDLGDEVRFVESR